MNPKAPKTDFLAETEEEVDETPEAEEEGEEQVEDASARAELPSLVPTTSGPLTPIDILNEKPLMKLMVVGEPGIGKTVLAASVVEHPDLAPAVVFSFEGGLLSVPRKYRDRIKMVPIRSIDDLERGFWDLVNKKPGWEKYKTAIIDSGTEMQTLSLENIVRGEFVKERKKVKDAAKRKRTLDDIFQADYGKDTARLKRIFRWFRDAPFHLVVTALPKKIYAKKRNKSDRNEEAKLVGVVPSFTDKLGTSVRGYMDFVWFLGEDSKKEHFLLTSTKGAYYAKTRGVDFYNAIGQVVPCPINEPVLANLYAKLVETEHKTGDKK